MKISTGVAAMKMPDRPPMMNIDTNASEKSMAVVIKDEQMHLLQLGDTIAGEVLVKAVSPAEITLQHVASKITQVIPATDEPAAGGQPN